jgi:hypothetical protein
MHIKLTDGQPQPYSIGQLRRDNPQVSFPSTIPADTLAEYDVYEVTEAQPPSYDSSTQTLSQAVELVEDVWTQVWTVAPLPQDQTESNIRSQRDDRLTRSDWTQVADAPVDKQAWADYRQALRDVPSQAGFPYSVIWPEQPTA